MEASAVGAYRGRSEFFMVLGEETGFNSRHLPDLQASMRRMNVPITTLDSYLKQRKQRVVHFIKIDVEGGELDVLKGGGELLTNVPRPIMLCEVSDKRTSPYCYKASQICRHLVQMDFRLFSFVGEGYLLPLKERAYYHENLLAVPDERLTEIADRIQPD